MLVQGNIGHMIVNQRRAGDADAPFSQTTTREVADLHEGRCRHDRLVRQHEEVKRLAFRLAKKDSADDRNVDDELDHLGRPSSP
jgi:hypothetical protein